MKITRRCVWFVLMAMLSSSAMAQGVDSRPLPVRISQEERAAFEMAGLVAPDTDDPPNGNVMSYPEWAPVDSVMIGWMWFNSYFIELTRGFQNAAWVDIVVESAAQESSVRGMLNSAGVPMDHIGFIRFPLDTCWIIDYGPFFIDVDGHQNIVDQMYPGRPDDDAFPARFADSLSIPFYTSDLRIEGGNFFPDGRGICFTTTYLFEQNAGYLSEQDVRDRMRDYCGCDTLHVLEPLDDYTGHIDMFAKLIDNDTMMIGQYEPGDPEYQKLEDNADFIEGLISSAGTHYEVVRIPMPGTPALYQTYTNGLIVNDHVFVPTYGFAEDTEAIAIHQGLFPDSTIVGINSLDPIEYGGAIHCTSKTMASESVPTVTPTVPQTPASTETPQPTPTPTSPLSTATSTPQSTATSTPLSTATSTPPSTATSTPPSTATSTPQSTVTSTPQSTATSTPSPEPSCGQLIASVRMPAHHFVPGNTCRCDVEICNPDSNPMLDIPVFVILDVYGSLFFAPGFGSFDHFTWDIVPGISTFPVIPEFPWPVGTGSAEGILWYAGMTNPGMSELLGSYSVWEFSWSDH